MAGRGSCVAAARFSGRCGALALVVSVVTWGVFVGFAEAMTTQGAEEARVDLELEVGFGGAVASALDVPVRATITSPRARRVELRVSWAAGARSYRLELPADAPVDVDFVVPSSGSVTAEVYGERDFRTIASATSDYEVAADLTAAGVGPSIAQVDSGAKVSTAAGIQQALLVPLDDVWSRPGALAALSTVVLGASDLDGLDSGQEDALRTWVSSGGDLVLDVPPQSELPLFGLSGDGPRTAVGAGWVRFTAGAAADGRWEDAIEPAAYRARSGQELQGFDLDQFAFGPTLGLVDVEFLPAWIVVVAVLGTAVLVGPVLWLVLRTNRRRRWMWVAAPGGSLLVAAGLLLVGQSVFADSTVRSVGDVTASPWGTTGFVAIGLKESARLELTGSAHMLDSSPDAVVTDTGAGTLVEVKLPINSFGELALGDVSIDGGPPIDVVATALPDGTAEITVTNNATTTLRNVVVSGAGRTRPFDDVPAGSTRTLPFDMSKDLSPFGTMFPQPEFAWGLNVTGGHRAVPASRGLVSVTGVLDEPPDTTSSLGRSGADGRMRATAVVPVRSDSPQTASLRIDPVRPSLLIDQERLVVDSARGVFVEEEIIIDENGMEVIVRTGRDAAEVSPHSFLRLSAATGRPPGPCAVHTVVSAVDVWDGGAWVPAEVNGEPYAGARFAEPNEVRDIVVPAVPTDGVVYLRLTSRAAVQPALLIDCGDR